MRKIILHGRLRDKFGPQYELDVASTHEAVRALCANFPAFHGEIIKGHYQVIAGPRRKGLVLDENNLSLNLPAGQSIHIIPRVRGAKNSGVGKLVIGVAMIAVGIASGGSAVPLFGGALGGGLTWGSVALIGASMAFAGVAQLLTPVPKSDLSSLEKPEDRPSFLLGGAVNVSEQGHPIPLCGGEMVLGGIVISAGITIEKMAV